jgi:hypothetical protein
MFKGLVVSRLDEWRQFITYLHNEIRHFGEGRTLAKVNKHYFRHNKTELVKDDMHICNLSRELRMLG